MIQTKEIKETNETLEYIIGEVSKLDIFFQKSFHQQKNNLYEKCGQYDNNSYYDCIIECMNKAYENVIEQKKYFKQ